MIKKPVTQEEKKLVGYLTKKKKQSGKSPHVYYNKRKANGKSNYLSGKFYSEKISEVLISLALLLPMNFCQNSLARGLLIQPQPKLLNTKLILLSGIFR